MRKFNSEMLYHLNKSPEDLIYLLSPEIGNPHNQELFYRISQNQKKFNSQLNEKEIQFQPETIPALEESLENIRIEFEQLIKINPGILPAKLDFDLAKIFHSNLKFSRASEIDYDFWRAITLFYFIDIVKWRWEKDPSKSSNWNYNAKSIFGRALGLTFDKKRYEEDGTIKYTLRNQRINSYRYWWIGNRLYDNKRGYYFLDKIAEKYKKEESSAQDFINHLEGNRLSSVEDRIAKIMADAILLSEKKYSEQEARDCFTRYNAYSNRLLLDAPEEIVKKEICLLS